MNDFLTIGDITDLSGKSGYPRISKKPLEYVDFNFKVL